MNLVKLVDQTLEEINDKEINEIEIYINVQIEKFNKIKDIKAYLKNLIISLESEINIIVNNFNNLKSREQIIELKRFKKILKKEKIIKKIYKQYKNEKNYKIIEDVEISDYNDFPKSNLDKYDINDIMIIFSKMIKSSNLSNNYEIIVDYSNYLYNGLVEDLYENSDLLIEFGYILDALKYRISKCSENSVERKLLKNIQKQFKSIYNLYKQNTKINISKKSYFEILNYYIFQENYFTIQELLRRKPELCNLKYNDKHIIIYIIDLYYDNFQKMVKDKNSEYINLNYLKELYMLFTKMRQLRITPEDRNIIDLKLNEIDKYIKSTLIKEKRKKYALGEIKQMRPSNFYSKTVYDYREITDDHMIYEKQIVLKNNKNYAKKMIDKGVKVEDSFVVGNTAFTLNEYEDRTILKIHTLNISPYIQEKSIVLQYFHKFIRENNYPDDFIVKNYKYEEDENYSVITYCLEFFKSGKFKKLSLEKNIININDIFRSSTYSDNEFSKFLNLYKKSINKNGGDLTSYDIYKMCEHFETILNGEYINFIRENRIPFIYYGYSKPLDSDLIRNRNNLITCLNDMDRKDALEILNIITSRVDINHYSVYPIENPVYDLKLIDNFNYIGIANQRALNEIYFNTCLVSDARLEKARKIYYQLHDKIVDEFNSYINYVDMVKVKKYHGKMLVRKKL